MKLCLRCNQYFDEPAEKCPSDGAILENVGKDPLIGALINNRYLVDSVIGKGSSGIVYKARRLGRGEMVVAIKVLHSYIGAAGSSLDRFLREAQAASRLRNPHIITIWDTGVTEDGQPYFVMDYLEGTTLGYLIKEKGNIEPTRVLSLLHQICEALVEAHRQGIVHRDLKPENIVLQESGQGHDYVKLLDFGIADSPQHAQSSFKLEKPRTVSGSPAYMSPEQCQGLDLDGRSDIYSLAIVVFEMLTGCRPFPQLDNVNVMVLHVNEPPMTLSAVRPDLEFPEDVENVIARALSKQPFERQINVQEFLLEFEMAWQNQGNPLSALAKAVVQQQRTILNESIADLKNGEHAKTTTSDGLVIQEGDELVPAWGNVSLQSSNKAAAVLEDNPPSFVPNSDSDDLSDDPNPFDVGTPEQKNDQHEPHNRSDEATADIKSKADSSKEAEAAKLAELAKQAELAKEAELAKQAQSAKEAELAKQAELAKEAELVKQAELAKETELAKQAELAKEAELVKQAELAKETELAKQAELTKAAELAKQAKLAKGEELVQQAELAKQKQAESAKGSHSWPALAAAQKPAQESINEQSITRSKTVDRLMEAAKRGQTHQKISRKNLPNPDLVKPTLPQSGKVAPVSSSALSASSKNAIPDLNISIPPGVPTAPTSSGWFALQKMQSSIPHPEQVNRSTPPKISGANASAISINQGNNSSSFGAVSGANFVDAAKSHNSASTPPYNTSADPTASIPMAETVDSYAKRALSDSRLASGINNEVQLPTDGLANEKVYGRSKSQELLITSRQGIENAQKEEFYIKQKYRNTLSRLETAKKSRRADNSLVSTRARAAALKADAARAPINLWFFGLTIIISACLLACAYIVYSALVAPVPPVTSLEVLISSGKYEQVIDILEGKRLSEPLSEAERNQLGEAYLHLAKQHLNQNKPDQALSLLSKIDPKSSSASESNALKARITKGKKPALKK